MNIRDLTKVNELNAELKEIQRIRQEISNKGRSAEFNFILIVSHITSSRFDYDDDKESKTLKPILTEIGKLKFQPQEGIDFLRVREQLVINALEELNVVVN